MQDRDEFNVSGSGPTPNAEDAGGARTASSPERARDAQYTGPSIGLRVGLVFIPYIVICAVHVWALGTSHEIEYPTKLALMSLLATAAILAVIGAERLPRLAFTVLLFGIAASWLGDGAAFFFPMFDDELPMMLLWFGIAHLAYMWLFWRAVPRRRVPVWAAVYAAWWIALLAVLAPHTGSLLIPVALYGLVLGGTAVLATRCGPVIAWGGAWFLVSDSILAFRLFIPELMPAWTSVAVMVTYTLGQGLIVYGVVRALRGDTPRNAHTTAIG